MNTASYIQRNKFKFLSWALGFWEYETRHEFDQTTWSGEYEWINRYAV
jgi:hypothetical protein